jgi:hypothetical protein
MKNSSATFQSSKLIFFVVFKLGVTFSSKQIKEKPKQQ